MASGDPPLNESPKVGGSWKSEGSSVLSSQQGRDPSMGAAAPTPGGFVWASPGEHLV